MPWNSAERTSICYAMEGVSINQRVPIFSCLYLKHPFRRNRDIIYPHNHCFVTSWAIINIMKLTTGPQLTLMSSALMLSAD